MVDDHVTAPVNANQNEFPMVIITDNKDEFSIFPPINHENLQLFTNQQIPQSKSLPSPPSSPSFSPSDCDAWEECSFLSSPFDSSLRKGCDFIGWLSIGFQILRSKLVSAVSSFRNRGGTNWSFRLRAATVLFIVMVLIRRRKNRRRTFTPNESRLMQIIMEKEGVCLNSIHYFNIALHLFFNVSFQFQNFDYFFNKLHLDHITSMSLLLYSWLVY